jgi:hypothetical protein
MQGYGILMRSFVLVPLFLGGCNRPSNPNIAPIPSLTVEELLVSPKTYSHSLVKVSGCYVSGFEKSVLQPCGNTNQSERIWVESAAAIYLELKRPTLPGMPEPTPEELMSSANGKILFEYDEGRNSRAWQRLESSSSRDPKASQVVFLGQLETIAPGVPKTMELGFGHLNAYPHELILVDVLGTSSSSPH